MVEQAGIIDAVMIAPAASSTAGYKRRPHAQCDSVGSSRSSLSSSVLIRVVFTVASSK